MKTLNTLIESLKLEEDVDALFIAGSQGEGNHEPYSDIDIVVIFKENTQKLRSLFQWIDNKPADIYFFDHVDLKNLQNVDRIPANKIDAVLINWLEKNTIEFDKSGLLTELKTHIEELKKKFFVPEAEMKLFEQKINIGYITNRRYFESNNPIYHEALETKLLQDIYNVLIGYFEFRNIPWRGEKFALKYLKNNDLTFYNQYMKAVAAGSLKDKFDLYSRVVTSVFNSNHALWSKDKIAPSLKENISKDQEENIIEYWKGISTQK